MECELEILEFCKQILKLKEIAEHLESSFTEELFGTPPETSPEDDDQNKFHSKIPNSDSEKMMHFWGTTAIQLDSLFYRISSYYKDEIERIIIYPFLTKKQFSELLHRRELAKDRAEDIQMEDWSNEGCNDFYEGFDKTNLGID